MIRHIALILFFLMGFFHFPLKAHIEKDCSTKNGFLSQLPLKIGDAAPNISVQEWIKGGPFSGLEKGEVYVVSFGAVTCGPCRFMPPVLSNLAEKYKGRIEILSIYGPNRFPNDVRNYFAPKIDQVSYYLAVDTKERSTSKKWYNGGIPITFLVNRQGKIAWIGLGNTVAKNLDGHIHALLEGSFDSYHVHEQELEKAQNVSRLRKLASEHFERKEYDSALVYMDSLIGESPNEISAKVFKYYKLLEIDSEKAYAYGHEMVDTHHWDYDQVYPLPRMSNLILLERIDNGRSDMELAFSFIRKVREMARTKEDLSGVYHFESLNSLLKGEEEVGIVLHNKAVASTVKSYTKKRFIKEYEKIRTKVLAQKE